jgi:SET domain-containing protein
MVKVRKSKFGRGVFATRPIKKGQTILVDDLLLLPANDYDKSLVIKHYAFSYEDAFMCCAIALGKSSLINHSFRPNCDYETTIDEHGFPKLKVYALKNIPAGAELKIDYGYDPAQPS